MVAKLPNSEKMAEWTATVERIVSKPPGSDDDRSPEDIERASKTSFAKCSTWEIICEEMLDTSFACVYFERAREELNRRGITDAEILEMRRFAWLTAGWLNFERSLWDWCSLDVQDIYLAIKWQYSGGYISAEERDRRIEFAKKYDTETHRR